MLKSPPDPPARSTSTEAAEREQFIIILMQRRRRLSERCVGFLSSLCLVAFFGVILYGLLSRELAQQALMILGLYSFTLMRTLRVVPPLLLLAALLLMLLLDLLLLRCPNCDRVTFSRSEKKGMGFTFYPSRCPCCKVNLGS